MVSRRALTETGPNVRSLRSSSEGSSSPWPSARGGAGAPVARHRRCPRGRSPGDGPLPPGASLPASPPPIIRSGEADGRARMSGTLAHMAITRDAAAWAILQRPRLPGRRVGRGGGRPVGAAFRRLSWGDGVAGRFLFRVSLSRDPWRSRTMRDGAAEGRSGHCPTRIPAGFAVSGRKMPPWGAVRAPRPEPPAQIPLFASAPVKPAPGLPIPRGTRVFPLPRSPPRGPACLRSWLPGWSARWA